MHHQHLASTCSNATHPFWHKTQYLYPLSLIIFVLSFLSACSRPAVFPSSPVSIQSQLHNRDQSLASEEELSQWQKVFRQYSPREQPSTSNSLKLDQEPTLQRVFQAQQYIQNNPRFALSLWNGQQLLQYLPELGKGIPLLLGSTDRQGESHVMEYLTYRRAIAVYADFVDTAPVERNAQALVHEVTHHLYQSEVQTATEYTNAEWLVLTVMCAEYSYYFHATTEILAYQNDSAWFESVRQTLPETQRPPAYLHERLFAEHDPVDIAQYIGKVSRAMVESTERRLAKLGVKSARCGAPAIMRGARRAQRFYPWDIAPERVIPILEHLPAFSTDP